MIVVGHPPGHARHRHPEVVPPGTQSHPRLSVRRLLALRSKGEDTRSRHDSIIARSAKSRAPVNTFRVCQPMAAIAGRRSKALRNVVSDRTAFDVTAAGRGTR